MCWECRCECGNTSTVTSNHLVCGSTTSCGCGHLENLRAHRNNRTLPTLQRATREITKQYRYRARKKGIAFTLGEADIGKLIHSPCVYCGGAPSNTLRLPSAEHEDFPYNGIDRVDSSKGYTPANTVPCCSHCNTAKLDRVKADFLDWVARVYHHNQECTVATGSRHQPAQPGHAGV